MIHPGYGFLSENATFARACEDAGIILFDSDLLEKMGDKVAAKTADWQGFPLYPLP